MIPPLPVFSFRTELAMMGVIMIVNMIYFYGAHALFMIKFLLKMMVIDTMLGRRSN